MPNETTQDLKQFIEKYEKLDDASQTIVATVASALLSRQSMEGHEEVKK